MRNKVKISVMVLALATALTACGKTDEVNKQLQEQVTDDSKQEQTGLAVDEQEEYRPFNASDYTNRNYVEISLSSEQNQEVKRQLQDSFSDDEYNSAFVKQVMIDYVFKEDCVELIPLGYIGKSVLGDKEFYYKVNVKDIEAFKDNLDFRDVWSPINTESWTVDDDIYMLCEYRYPDESVIVNFYLCNYSVAPIESVENPTTDQEAVEIVESNSTDGEYEIIQEIGRDGDNDYAYSEENDSIYCMKVLSVGLDQITIRFMNNNNPIDVTYHVDGYELATEEVEYPIFSCQVHDDNGNRGEINYSFGGLYVSCIPSDVDEANTQYGFSYPLSEDEASRLQDKYVNEKAGY